MDRAGALTGETLPGGSGSHCGARSHWAGREAHSQASHSTQASLPPCLGTVGPWREGVSKQLLEYLSRYFM